MSDSTFAIGVVSIIITAPVLIFFFWLLFRKSILFTILLAFAIPLDSCALVGFVMGAKGLIHLFWCAPVVFGIVLLSISFLKKIIIKPIVEIRDTSESLSKGKTNVQIGAEYLKRPDEIGKAMQMIDKLILSLKNVVSFANNIGKGNLAVDLQLTDQEDEIGKAMIDMRDNLKKADAEKLERQDEDKRRNWVTDGIAKFAELLRTDNQNMTELCNNIISKLVNYTGTNQGGLFIVNDDDKDHIYLEMMACYAYERRKFVDKKVEFGEGLVGTCYLEGESIYMTHLPKDYIQITSGLGGDSPKALLITPMKVNDEIYGVIELASFHPLEPHVVEFVEKIAESIASTIGTAKTNIRTNKLLELSKIQAEEMANQEEELRQNMEEMQATQEEMRRREIEMTDALDKMKVLQQDGENKEYESQQLYRSILKIFNAVEFTGSGVLEAISGNVLRIFGNADESDFVGKSFPESYPGGIEEGETVWQKLRHGEQVSSTSEINQKNVRLEYIPVFDMKHNLNKVVAFVMEE